MANISAITIFKVRAKRKKGSKVIPASNMISNFKIFLLSIFSPVFAVNNHNNSGVQKKRPLAYTE